MHLRNSINDPICSVEVKIRVLSLRSGVYSTSVSQHHNFKLAHCTLLHPQCSLLQGDDSIDSVDI